MVEVGTRGTNPATFLLKVPSELSNRLSSFAMHPLWENRMALLSATASSRQVGSIEKVYVTTLRRDIDCNVSTDGEIAFAKGNCLDTARRVRALPSTGAKDGWLAREPSNVKGELNAYFCGPYSHDLASTMRRRVKAGYGYGMMGASCPLASKH